MVLNKDKSNSSLKEDGLNRLLADLSEWKDFSRRWRTIPIYRAGEPKAEGVEFVVGPMDPPVTVAEIVLAATDPAFGNFKPEEIQISGDVTEDGYTAITLSRVPKSGQCIATCKLA